MLNGLLKKSLLNRILWGCIAGIFVLIGVGSFSCHKGSSSSTPKSQCAEFEFPDGLNIEIMENGKYVSDSIYLSQLTMIAADNQGPIDDLHATGSVLMPDGTIHRFITSRSIQLSSVLGLRIFYLQYPDKKQDTIYLDEQRTPATNCEFVQDSLLFNGIRPTTDSLLYIDGDSTYVLNHQ